MNPTSTVENQKTAAEQACEPHLFGFCLAWNTVRHRHPGSLGDYSGLVEATLGNQPRHRLGQLEKRQWQQRDKRQRPDQEQAAPTDGIQQNDGEERTQQAPQRHARVADGAAEVLLSWRGDFGDQGAGGGDQRPHAKAGDEPKDAERRGVAHQRGDGHAKGEPRVGAELKQLIRSTHSPEL
jgi:hypothetical protein